jgi:DNA mismatch repair protein MutS2
MRDEIIKFIQDNKLSIFGRNNVRSSSYSIFKTKDAKEISQKVLALISENFIFNDTKQLLKIFDITQDSKEIEKRQSFFKSISKIENSHFKKLKKGISSWKPNYDTAIVTEDESTLVRLKELGCSVVFINQQSDLFNLDRYDLIQFIDCGNFETMLERIPQAIPIDKIEDACLERFLIQLSAWEDNIEELRQYSKTDELGEVLNELDSIIPLINKEEVKTLDFRAIEAELERINEKIISKIKEMTLSGESVVSLLIKGIPKEIRDILEKELSQSHIPRELFQDNIPLKLDEKEVDSFLKKQSIIEFTNSAAEIKKETKKINAIPKLLSRLESELIYQDFISGVTKFFEKANSFPRINNEFNILNSRNLFIENPQPITFKLNQEKRCSILTGANSGGKTTLIEHIIQLISLFQLGFPVSGELSIPFFTEIYYFAKNKGSMSKGAFENLLTQMSEIQPGEQTLILADEIEAVTEPGVAGEIIVSTAEYFIEKNCFLVIATHLGQEVQHLLPEKCRIDGIEAKGLTENYELIVDHNPILGKLANSTPELIIEKMAKAQQKPYFTWLFENLKKRKS